MELITKQIGPYTIDEEIGRGNSAVVFLATDTLYQRQVALKVLSPYREHEANEILRFISEGREAARLRHPNIAQVYEAGQADGYSYIAMEFADGEEFGKRFNEQSEPLAVGEALELIAQLTSALDHAHGLDFVHPHLTPKQILWSADKRPLLTGFEHPEQIDDVEPSPSVDLTLQRLAYMAPEQARGELIIDYRADIYRLGIIAYHLLTGELPFVADNALALLRKIVEEEPEAPISLNAKLTPTINVALMRVLAKDPAKRFASGSEFSRALVHHIESDPEAIVPSAGMGPVYATTKGVSGPSNPFALVRKGKAVAEEKEQPQTISISRRNRRSRIVAVGIAASIAIIALVFVAFVQFSAETLDELAAMGIYLSLEPTATVDSTSLAIVAQSSVTPAIAGQDEFGQANIVIADAIVPVPLVTYLDPQQRFRMAVPVDWSAKVHDGATSFNSKTLPIQFFVYQLNDIQPTDKPQTLLQRYLDTGIYVPNAVLQDVRALDEQPRRIGEHSAHEQLLAATLLGTPVAVHLVALNENGIGYIIGSSAESSQESKLRPLLNAVIDSFQLTRSASRAIAAVIPTSIPTALPTATATPLPTATARPTSSPTPVPAEPELVFVSNGASGNGDPNNSVSGESAAIELELDSVVTDVGSDSDFNRESASIVEVPAPSGHIAYAIWNPLTDRMDTYIYSIANGVSWPRLENKRQPDFSVKGELLLNGEGGDIDNIIRMQTTGDGIFVLSTYSEDSRPHWSPDAKQVVYDSTSVGDRRPRIYLLPDVKVRHKVPPIMYEAWELFGQYPIFLSDHHIAYKGCNVWENGGTCGIYITDPQGSRPQASTRWPGDIPTDNLGTQILFMSAREKIDKVDNWDVYRVNQDGSGLQRLTHHPARDGLATASPDGNYIAFVTDRESHWSVYIMQTDGRQQQKLFDLEGDYGRGGQYWHQDWKQERLSWGH